MDKHMKVRADKRSDQGQHVRHSQRANEQDDIEREAMVSQRTKYDLELDAKQQKGNQDIQAP